MHPAAACHSCFLRRSHAAKLVSALWRPTTPRVRLMQLLKKTRAKSIFAGRFRKGTGCLSRRTTPVRFKNDTCPLLCVSWHRQHCRHRCKAKTTCGAVHQEQRCAMRDSLHRQRDLRGQPGLRTLGVSRACAGGDNIMRLLSTLRASGQRAATR